MDDLRYMQMAYQLALKGKGTTSPNPMVGAVIVKKGKVLAEGWHKRCGGPHAEVVALKKAGPRAQGATLYVTLEPCHHYGRTPPCVDAVIKSGIREVVVGMKDPNPLTNGKSIQKMRGQGIRVRSGILKKELMLLNEAFVKYSRERKPFVTAKIAQTLDGKIATAKGQSNWITSLATRNFTRRLRNDFDAILVGVNTVLKDDPCLCAACEKKHLKKIVLDSKLRIPLTAKMFAPYPQDCLIVTTQGADQAKMRRLNKQGIQVLVGPSCSGRVDLQWLMKELVKIEITSVLVEGGPTVIGEALKQQLVDKMRIFIAPKILGDETARSAVQGLRCAHVDQNFKICDIKTRQVGPDLFLEGYVEYQGRV